MLEAAMALLSDAQIEQHLQGSQWQRDGDSIVRDLQLADFAAAIALVDRVAELAESANHHPDILVHGWNKLRLTLSTHSAGGLTAADFALAERIDSLS
jgi:4a-hydroxytetrahydrobiopterin dehydratase